MVRLLMQHGADPNARATFYTVDDSRERTRSASTPIEKIEKSIRWENYNPDWAIKLYAKRNNIHPEAARRHFINIRNILRGEVEAEQDDEEIHDPSAPLFGDLSPDLQRAIKRLQKGGSSDKELINYLVNAIEEFISNN